MPLLFTLLALGHSGTVGAAPCPLECASTNASGQFAVALGLNTTASGEYSVAVGLSCTATDKSAVALGHMTSAGAYSTAMGYKTFASHTGTAFGYMTSATGLYSAAFGNYVGTTERESLIVSGKVHAQNIHIFAEDRLVTNVTAARNHSAMLSQLRALELAEFSPSPEFCTHRGISAQRCSAQELRSVGLLASRLESAMPAAVVRTGTSLNLAANPADRSLKQQQQQQPPNDAGEEKRQASERIDNIRSLDVSALLAHMIGSIQALDTQVQASTQQLESQQADINELRATVAAQKTTIALLQQQQQHALPSPRL